MTIDDEGIGLSEDDMKLDFSLKKIMGKVSSAVNVTRYFSGIRIPGFSQFL
jgi:hypothetical protein